MLKKINYLLLLIRTQELFNSNYLNNAFSIRSDITKFVQIHFSIKNSKKFCIIFKKDQRKITFFYYKNTLEHQHAIINRIINDSK